MDKYEIESALKHIDKLHAESHSQNGSCQIAACVIAAALRAQGQRIEKLEALLDEIKQLRFHDHSDSPTCSMCDIEKAIAELEDK